MVYFPCGLFSLFYLILTPSTRTPWVKSNNFGNFSCTLLQHFSVLIIEYRDLICLLLIAPFSIIWNRHHCRCRAANLGLWSALNSLSSKVRGWRVTSTVTHGIPFICNLRGPETFIHVIKRLIVELSLPVLITISVCRYQVSNFRL